MADSTKPVSLRRELRLGHVIAVSVAMMTPTMAIALNTAGAAGLVGRAVPLAFLFAAVGVALVAYAFISIARRISHAGSAYAFTGLTLGPRAGFVAGWALLGTYAMYTAAAAGAFGFFGNSLLAAWGVTGVPWWLLAIAALALCWLFAARDVRTVSKLLAAAEGLSVLLVLALVAVIFVRAGDHSVAGHSDLSLSVFSLTRGISFHAVAVASVFGFLSFAGFEGAAAMGEETTNARRDIPRALAASVAVIAVLFLVSTAALAMGFGPSAAGSTDFSAAANPLQTLADRFVGSSMGDALTAGAALSAFGGVLAMPNAAARLLFAFSRDALMPPPLSVVAGNGSPARSLLAVLGASTVTVAGFALGGIDGEHTFFYLGTIGTLLLIVAYMMVNIGALRWTIAGRLDGGRAAAILPLLALVVLGFALYSNVWPVPVSPFDEFPYIALGWLAVGVAILLVRSRQVAAAGRHLLATNLSVSDPLRTDAEVSRAAVAGPPLATAE
jgi:amino acid transporter